MASGPYLATSPDHTFDVYGRGGNSETIPYVEVAYHVTHDGYRVVARALDGTEQVMTCAQCGPSAYELLDWFLGVVRHVAAA